MEKRRSGLFSQDDSLMFCLIYNHSIAAITIVCNDSLHDKYSPPGLPGQY